MHKQFFENPGKSPMYVGNTMIPPGEGRLVDVHAAAPAPAETAQPNLAEQIREVLQGTVRQVVEQLPTLSIAALDLITDLEASDQNRKTLLTAVDAERFTRANQVLEKQQADQAAAARQAALQQLQDAQAALAALAPDAAEDVRAAAQAAVTEAQAKADALADELE